MSTSTKETDELRAAEEERLVALENDLRSELRRVGERLKELRLEQHDLTIGDYVRGTTRSLEGKLVKVVGVRLIGRGRPWVSGFPIRKDGTVGTRHRNLFSNWEHVDQEEARREIEGMKK